MEKKLLARYPIGNPRRVWRQDNFIFCISSAAPVGLDLDGELLGEKIRRSVKTCVEAGFNLIGTLWASPAVSREILRAAEGLGANVLYQNLKRCGGMGNKNIFCETHDLEGVLDYLSQWKCPAALWIWDEPFEEEHMRLTRDMIDRCEKLRPDLLPCTVAVPSYNPLHRWDNGKYEEYIRRFVEIIDPAQMHMDYYPIGLPHPKDDPHYSIERQLDRSHFWLDLEVVRRVAKEREIPNWFAYQGHKFHFCPHTRIYIFPMIRAMANAALMYGVKALDHYTEFEGVIDPETGGKGWFFEDMQKFNREVAALGNTLMALTCQRVIHDETLLAEDPYMAKYRTSMEESELLTGKLNPRVSVSEHSDIYGNRYLMVLNRDYEQAAYMELELKTPSHVYRVSREDGEQRLVHEKVKKMVVALAPGDLALYRIQPANEKAFLIEYYLEKEVLP